MRCQAVGDEKIFHHQPNITKKKRQTFYYSRRWSWAQLQSMKLRSRIAAPKRRRDGNRPATSLFAATDVYWASRLQLEQGVTGLSPHVVFLSQFDHGGDVTGGGSAKFRGGSGVQPSRGRGRACEQKEVESLHGGITSKHRARCASQRCGCIGGGSACTSIHDTSF